MGIKAWSGGSWYEILCTISMTFLLELIFW